MKPFSFPAQSAQFRLHKSMKTASSLVLFVPVLVLLASPVFGVETPTPTAVPTPTPSAEQKKILDDAQAALTASEAPYTNSITVTNRQDAHVRTVKELSVIKFSGNDFSTRLDQLTEAIQAIGESKELTALKTARTKLDNETPAGIKQQLASHVEKLKTEAAKTDVPANVKELIVARQAALEGRIVKVEAQVKASDAARDSLLLAIDGVYSSVQQVAKAGATDVKIVSEHGNKTGEALLETLGPDIKRLNVAQSLRVALNDSWKGQNGHENLHAALQVAQADRTPEADGKTKDSQLTPAVETQITALDDTTTEAFTKPKAMFASLFSYVDGKSSDATTLYQELLKLNDDTSSTAFRGRLDKGQKARAFTISSAGLIRQLDAIVPQWNTLKEAITDADIADKAELIKAGDKLSDSRSSLEAIRTVLTEWLTGDMSGFVGDQVTLFYFGDVPRLMKTLNSETHPIGGLNEVKAQAVEARRKLIESDASVSETEQQIRTQKARLIALREELRQSKTQFFNASDFLKRSTRYLTAVRKKQTAAQTAYDTAQNAAEAEPNNTVKQEAAEKAKAKKEEIDTIAEKEKDRNDDAIADEADKKASYEKLKDEENGLPARISESETALLLAQADVRRLRNSAILAVQNEVTAFATQRDNQPILYAPADGLSSDVARRVVMFAFDDSKTIFIRGRRDDVLEVKDLIAMFDRPVPQARLTLWSLELNSDGDKKVYDRFNKALVTIEGTLADTRAQLAVVTSTLRDCLNKEVNRVSDENQSKYDSIGGIKPRNNLARYHFYSTEVLSRSGFEFCPPDVDYDMYAALVKGNLPDPAATTTLGEVLLVMALGRRVCVETVLNEFESRISSEEMFGSVKSRYADNNGKSLNISKRRYKFPDNDVWFISLRAALGVPARSMGFKNPSVESMTPIQMEVLRALLRVRFADVSMRLQFAHEDISKLIDKELTALEKNPTPDEEAAVRARLGEELTKIGELRPTLTWLSSEYYDSNFTNAYIALDAIEKDGDLKTNLIELKNSLKVGSSRLKQKFSPAGTNARIAAADEMLKQVIISVEDDMDRHIVYPMLNQMRSDLRAKGIGLGNLQKTTTLASNRLIARVDPKASAEIQVGREVDALQSAQQLAQISLAAQAGGIPATLSVLNTQPQDEKPELYGITSGSVFQVTPIIDPSGQALRFKFDYTKEFNVTEPDGTINPALPRVKRHSINTEVQLSNLEIRNISQFETNVALGVPKRFSGGIPILKDLPGIQEIPLLGWFKRRGGRNAVVQQSVIFAQTAIYPTIGDMTNLLIETRDPLRIGEIKSDNSVSGN